MKNFYILLVALLSFTAGFSQAPSTQASNVQITLKTTGTATISWTRGNGSAVMIAVRKSSSSYAGPPSSTTTNYTADSNYGNGTSIGVGDNYVVYEGTGTSVTISGLTANTLYYVYAYEYTSQYSFPNVYYLYNTTTSTSSYEALNTLDSSPTGLSSVSSVTASYTSATLNITAGSGVDGSLLYIRPSSGSNTYPTDGYYYAGSTTYGAGTALGGGYVMYNGTSTSVNVSNLAPATLYYAYAQGYADGTYPTTSTYALNSRNYYLSGSGYGFYTSNYVPTIASIANYTVCQNAPLQTINFSGISDGSTLENQSLSVSATSSNTALIPNPTVVYTSPNSTGSIKFTPNTGVSGTTVISVTVNDGWFSNNTATAQFTVTVNPIPSAPTAISGSSPICAGTSATYTVSGATNATGYTWTAPTGFTITAGQGTNAVTVSTATNTTTGSLSVYGTNSFGCGNGNPYAQSIQVDANPSTPNAGPDQPLICSQTAFLNATAAGSGETGVWSWYSGTPTPSIGSSSSNSTSLSGLTGSNTYMYIWTLTKSGSVCPPKRDTVTLTTDWSNGACSPAANFNYSPVSDVSATSVCKSTLISFTDLSVSADTWNWDFNYNGSSPVFSTTLQNPTHTYNTAGTYTIYLRIHSNTTGFDYNTTKTITVIDAPATPGVIGGTTNGICAGSAPLQFNYSITNVTNATGYNWTVPSGANIVNNPSPNFIVVEYGDAAVPGNITVSSQNSCGTSTSNTLMINLTPLPSAPGALSGPSSTCQGEQNVLITVPAIANATSYQWTDLDGTHTSTGSGSQTFDIGLNAVSGRIYVKGINSCGAGDSNNFNLTVNPLPANVGLISGTSLLSLCPTATNVSFDVDPVLDATNYTWLVSNGVINSGNGTDSVTIDFSGVSTSSTIQVIPSNACGVRDSSAVFNVNFASLPTVDICVASVDSASQHNEIYWVRPASTEIDSFRIYRKISALVDTLIGTVAYEDPSMIVDTLSDYDPNNSLEQYCISAVDTCGNEGSKSAYHTTMFLTTSNGTGTVNLGWNLYIGQTVDFYKVYRDTSIAGGQWDLLDGAVNPTATVWVDNNPVAGAKYRIEVEWLTTCDPTRGAINTSRSNIKSPNSIGVEDIVAKSDDINVYPNPANDYVTVNFGNINIYKNIQVYDALGKLILDGKIESNDYKFEVTNFAMGVYTIVASGNNGKATKKLIVK